MLKQLFLILSVCVGSIQAYADIPKAYIFAEDSFFGEVKVAFPEKKAEGIFELSDMMSDNPVAAEYAKKYESSRKWELICLLGAIGMPITYASTSRYQEFSSGIYWGLFFAGFIPALYFSGKSRFYFYKAINTYNGVPDDTPKTSFYIVPTSSETVAGIRYSF